MSQIRRIKEIFHFKNGNLKTYLFFLILTTILWVLMKFSRNYTHLIAAKVHYENVPLDKLINKQSDSVLEFVLNGNGFKLMNYQIFTPVIEIDIESMQNKNGETRYLVTRENRSIFKEQLGYNGQIQNFGTDTLFVKFDKTSHKKVPVIADQKLSYAAGYFSQRGLELVPDSVVVKGAASIVDTIQSLTTETIIQNDIQEDLKLEVPLKVEGFSADVHIAPTSVQGFVEVGKFTEGVVTVPITIKANGKKNIKIFPKEVNISFNVSLKEYGAVDKSQFEVVADFTESTAEGTLIPLTLKEKPSSIQNVRLRKKQVQFVIVK